MVHDIYHAEMFLKTSSTARKNSQPFIPSHYVENVLPERYRYFINTNIVRNILDGEFEE